jgi:thiamine biosynthesis protein ThiC
VIFMFTDGVGLAPFRAGAQATAAALAAAGNDVGVGVGGGSASEPTAADARGEAARRQFEAALRAKQAKALCEMREWQAARAQGACVRVCAHARTQPRTTRRRRTHASAAATPGVTPVRYLIDADVW